jgi:RHH-type transcriptional regulator, proline utilization regulon repressor / proline dehydrogenase / delta 1-pyrroline-5-carboxylate dehydrogenase
MGQAGQIDPLDQSRRSSDDLRQRIRNAYRDAESARLQRLVDFAALSPSQTEAIHKTALRLTNEARQRLAAYHGIEAFFREYDLSSTEGVLLMCLAEALLRIPDKATQEALIQDKLSQGKWDSHLGSTSMWVNASTWGLILTGRVVALPDDEGVATLKRLVGRLGTNVARRALAQAMAVLARHFVAGATIDDALRRRAQANTRHSYDCLGEAARRAADVERYFAQYRHAIDAVARLHEKLDDPFKAEGVSIKLSALHPRLEYSQRERVMRELIPRVRALAIAARAGGVQLTLDAEEAHRLELQLDVVEALAQDPALAGWDGLGLAVQAYQKRALPVLEWLADLAHDSKRRFPVRLVKGAYWDSEIKRAQQLGLDDYPVYTRKAATDVSFLACAHYLFDRPHAFYPQFATHNAHTVAYILEIAQNRRFEFQRLHGMGEALYEAVSEITDTTVRVYSPVGSHAELLPYLVRRLLENGANTSFVNRLTDARVPSTALINDPVAHVRNVQFRPHPRVPRPPDIYLPERANARGWDINDPNDAALLDAATLTARRKTLSAAPLVDGREHDGTAHEIRSPANREDIVGTVTEANAALAALALDSAARAQPGWDRTPAEMRAAILERAAVGIEAQYGELATLIAREGGRTLADALAEIREAADACRYYATRARHEFAQPLKLPGPSGESNALYLHGRGAFACVSPWNFPLAIFVGQVAAALAAGNSVVAKPARQTPLVAAHAVRTLHDAGVPPDVLHFIPGPGADLGTALLRHERLAGVALTGSTATAWSMQEQLAHRRGAIVPLIAETGGQNVLIADSSALLEQLTDDALTSAFNSAGQRCSALRVLFLQEDIADRTLAMLAEAMDELRVGDPLNRSTDVGPVIDEPARRKLEAHVARMEAEARRWKIVTLSNETASGNYFAPRLYEIDRLDRLTEEVFGPVLHVVRFAANALDRVIDAVNATGYGLTLGVHSRIEPTWEYVRRRTRVGNVYVNRNIIGAVVGAQPFGGEGLSGTGPKAGGPHYLHRFATERTVTINTAAFGGNVGLLSLDD